MVNDNTIQRLRWIMPYPRCPHCGSIQLLESDTYRSYRGEITCFDCKGKYYVEFGDNVRVSGHTLISPPRPMGDPQLLKGLMPILPNAIYVVYEEATRCLAFGVPRGAAVLCRYAVQLALILKGIPDKQPEEMVNIAAVKNPPLLSEIAVRQCRAATFMGGKAGHPQSNWAENIGENDAKQALLASRRVLLELFNPSSLYD